MGVLERSSNVTRVAPFAEIVEERSTDRNASDRSEMFAVMVTASPNGTLIERVVEVEQIGLKRVGL